MSLQLDHYLDLRAAGVTASDAASQVGFSEAEAKLTEKAIQSGELQVPTKEETNMPKNDNDAGTTGLAGDRLRLFIERVERLEEEKKGIGEDISDVYNEAKSDGFDTKTMKRIIKLRKMEPNARKEAEALLETYMNAIGMTPIEEAIALAVAA